MNPLQQHHLEDLKGSGLSNETIADAKLYSADEQRAAKVLEGRPGCEGLAIPYFDIENQLVMTRIKPDRPPRDKNGKASKYLTAMGASNRLYLPPTLPEGWHNDPDQRLLITEGEKKALKATQEGYPCVAVSGVWNFRAKNEKGEPEDIADFNAIEWSQRNVFIAYDSDLTSNSSVKKAEKALAERLTQRGAQVRLCRLPVGAADAKQGLDDFLVANPSSALEQLLDKALSHRSNSKEAGRHVAAELIDKIRREATLFIDQFGRPHARVTVNSHLEIIAIESKSFLTFLRKTAYSWYAKPTPKGAIETAQEHIEAEALCEGAKYTLHNRMARHGDELYYDLTDEQHRAIRITSDGWSIQDRPPILFRRETHQKPQVEPVKGGDPVELFEFITVAGHSHILLLTWLTACFIPEIAHPVLILHGPQGSGKSTAFRYLRRLVDPSVMETLSLPRNDDVIQMLSHHWFNPLDNIDGFNRDTSDILCRAVTGDAQMKRVHYTNDDDFIYQYRRCIGLNGINIAATRPDLLDRSILISLQRIADTDRRTEQELEDRWATLHPQILGGLLDVLSTALRIYPDIKLKSAPRMADFAYWGCAIAEALKGSCDRDLFLLAYSDNIERQNEEALMAMPMSEAIITLMEQRETWQGTPSQLLTELNDLASQQGINTQVRGWPKAANALTRRLNEMRSNLEQVGIDVEVGKSGRRWITLKKSCANTVQTAQTVQVVQDNDLGADGRRTVLIPDKNTVHISSSCNSLHDNKLDGMDSLDGISPTSNGGNPERHGE